LFEIKSEPDEIFISAATVSDVETITEITAKEIQASGIVLTGSTSTSTITGITSSASSALTTSTTGGGLTSTSATSSNTGSSY